MKVTNIETEKRTATVVASANINLSHEDAKFMYHSIKKAERKQAEYYSQMNNPDKSTEPIEEAYEIYAKMSALLMPILEQILVPVEDVDTFLAEFNVFAPQEKAIEAVEESTYGKFKKADYTRN